MDTAASMGLESRQSHAGRDRTPAPGRVSRSGPRNDDRNRSTARASVPKENAGRGIVVTGIRDRISPQARTLILAVLGAVLCLTLIGCTNLASLLFARVSGRQQEIALRAAIGAGRECLVRQLLTDVARARMSNLVAVWNQIRSWLECVASPGLAA